MNPPQTSARSLAVPEPRDEPERLRALERYKILGTEPEDQLDDITLLAARICHAPIATITLVDHDRQWFKSTVGLTARETPRNISFCAHTILQADLMIVENATEDERFAASPLVTGDPGIRFYAGSPLVTPEGHALGTLCVIDREPRVLSEEQKDALRALGRQVMAQFELRRSLAESRQTVARLEQAEESLRLFGSAVEQASEGILITDAELALPGPRITFVNPAFTKMTGYGEEDCLGQTPRLFQGPRTDRAVTQRLRESLARGVPFFGEALNYRKDGTEYFADWQISPICNASGSVTHFVSVQRDITRRKGAEEELRESQHFLKSTLDALSAQIAILDESGEIIFVNRAWEQFASANGGDTNRGEGCNYLRVCDNATGRAAEEAASVAAGIRAVMTGERSEFALEYPCHAPQEQRWFLVRVTRFPDDGPIRVVVSHVNITSRKQAQDALQASVEEFRTLAEAMPQIVWVTRPDGWHTHFNQRWLDYTGLSLEESLGHGWLAPFHPEDQPVAAKLWAAANQSGTPYEIEYRLRGADGNYRWMLGRALPLRSAAGKIVKWFGTCTDIHEMKTGEIETLRTSQEIERLNAELEERVTLRTEALTAATFEAERANHAKSEFLSRMSHELRTPLNAILGFAQVLESENGLTVDQRESLDHVLKGGSHLLKLINEVLDISSVEAGKLTLSTEAIALPALVQETVGLLRPMALEFDVRILVLAEAESNPYVQADHQRLRQVLLNLLSNAIKYNRPGGTVTVRFGQPGSDPANTRLSVSDTGIGISPERMPRLFNAFDRLGAEQTSVEGTGLGLVLARRMVEHMKGTLGVESSVGEGSTFWVELPTAEPPVEGAISIDDPLLPIIPEIPTDSRVVLSIEDNPSNTRLITRILARRPAIELLNADTGASGLRLARENHPDLILLDLHLPDSDGEQVLARLTSDPITANIPVVIVTANVVGKHKKLISAGARAFLTKPVDVRTFLAVVDQFLKAPPAPAS